MLPKDLKDLLTLYAERGVTDWKSASYRIRSLAGRCLGAQIAENTTEANVTIATQFSPTSTARLRFIPMPDFPGKRGFQWSFFIPLIQFRQNVLHVEYNLFILIDGTHWLAYRFEPAHPRPGHDYGHVQLCQQLVRRTVQPDPAMNWLPASYPAFALGTSDPLRMFLSMATALHGNSGGIDRVISEMFVAASRPRDVSKYIAHLKHMMN